MNHRTWVRRRLRGWRTAAFLTARALSRTPRLRPALIVIGAMRAGSSSMFHALTRHPGVVGSLRKEVHYFDANWHRPPDWYWRHFPTVPSAAGRLAIEATPSYLFHPDVPARMRSLLPDVKLVVLLRHPVERTLSHYFHHQRRGEEPRGLREALWSPLSVLAPEEAIAQNGGEFPHRYRALAYVARSRYAPQLRRWFDVYGRERVLVLLSEEFFAEPGAGLARVVEFAGLPPAAVEAGRVYNAGAKAARDPGIARELWEAFRESNAELEALLGRPLPWRAPA